MNSPQAQSNAVKAAISTGNATLSTVTTLQSLLSAETRPTVATNTQPERKASTRKPTTSAKSGTQRPSKKDESIDVHHDGKRSLTPKERYALATEVVNITLKALTESLKTKTKQPSKTVISESKDCSAPATPRKLSRTSSSVSQRALQPRSGNTTPGTATPTRLKGTPKKAPNHSKIDTTEPAPHLSATGECSRLAFSFLRSANTKQLGVRDLPVFQLENGMLALAGKLLALGLDSLAVKELRIVKSRLEAIAKPKTSGPPEKETLAGLLQVSFDGDKKSAALPLIITYQSLVLRAIASSSKPATIEASLEFLDPSQPLSPASLITLQSEQSGDKGKAGRLVEVLSSTILGLCPSPSSKVDQTANDRTSSPAPEAVLRLQTIGLQLRKQWWTLAGHKPDIEKELLDPAFRCIGAFIRRTRKRRTIQQIYDAACQCAQNLVSEYRSRDSKAVFSLSRTLSSLAEETGKTEEARKWAVQLDQQCENLDSNHAQRVAAMARCVPTLSPDAASTALEKLITILQGTVSGTASDYECLLADLSRSLAKLPADGGNDAHKQKYSALAVAFALRFVRSYPGKGLVAAQNIIHHAFRQSVSADAATSWISHEATQVLVDTGAMKTVSQASATTSTESAWSSNHGAITLERALRLLVIRALKSEAKSTLIFDDERLDKLERGLLLERQLEVAIEHAGRSKYQAVLQSLIPQLLQPLDQLLSIKEHPVRRVNLATQVLRLHGEFPILVPQQLVQTWTDTLFNVESLGKDDGLRGYAADVSSALEFAKVLHTGHPSIGKMKPLLLTWQRLLDEANEDTALESKVLDPRALRVSLKSAAAFFGAVGEDTHRMSTLALIDKLACAQGIAGPENVLASIGCARQWLSLGFSERAGSLFARSEKHTSSDDISILTKIQWHLAYAEYLLAIDNLDKCKCSLETAQALRDNLPPKAVSRDERASYERAHSEGWLLHSKYSLATGAPQNALASAKHAMKIANSAWCRLEKGQSEEASKPEDELASSAAMKDGEIAELTTGVSKLQLLPKGSQKEYTAVNIKGAAFWPLVPLLCQALMHLSDMYTHHGLFTEANYYSGKAIEVAESVGASVLLSRVRSHRAMLLSRAGKVEEAELCLVESEGTDISSSPFATVERLQAQAAVRIKEGSVEEAAIFYAKADKLVLSMQTEDFMSSSRRFEEPQENKTTVKTTKATKPTVAARSARNTTRSRKATDKPVPVAPAPPARTTKTVSADKSFYVLEKMRASILLGRTLLDVDSGIEEGEVLKALLPLKSFVAGTLKQRRVQHRQLMAKAGATLQMDFAYNILPDSTLSLPALLMPAQADEALQSAGPAKKASSSRTNAKAGQRKTAAKPGFRDVLQEARGCLLSGSSLVPQYCTSAEAYTESSDLVNVSTMYASVDATVTAAGLNSVQVGLTLDFPRINALQFEQSAVSVDANHDQRSMPFEWPTMTTDTPSSTPSAAQFQNEYVNTIPKLWTAVSISLDESCTSLYVARYRAEQTPFIVRLPFSRHQDEELGNEAFDYAAGKEELQDIIQRSNTSCHNNGDMSAKGAKSNWWKEREGLDRQLQELLINIEEMWFGGFKGIFSPRTRQPDLLARFRASFEAALDRHLPSRNATKSRAPKLRLDHNLLELFVNLGSDNDDTTDLDEPISDLLYFVVDMLQFNGERNAYDEIDFDELTVEVLDALRSYHEASEIGKDEQEHVVLVLDKRLQAFPWENLPCLEQISVSRVGSMLSLRDCITAMRMQDDAAGRHLVSRKSGAFILNPSADLASTQAMLQPVLSKAASIDGADWSSFINQAPSEDELRSTLEKSAMTLYFGHGAGSQYIRPRAVKKLDRCSEVVWLMGCSSGAVTEYGELEPQAVPLAYLNAGSKATSASPEETSSENSKCLTVVATLWDVTDKDIDRFSLTIGEEWGLWPPSAEPSKVPSKTPKKRERLAAPSTPQRAPKTPKTPRVVQTPAAAKTPARSRSRSTAKDRNVQRSLADAVAKSRDACYLRYLNGAAPVVYGVPVYLGD